MGNVVAASAEGYAFPTNLHRDQPIGGQAPQTQAELILQAVAWRLGRGQVRRRAARPAGPPASLLNCRSFRPGYRSSPGGPVGFDQVVTCASIRRDRTCPYHPGAEPEVDAVDVEVVLEDQQARGGHNADVILTEPPLAVTFVQACSAVDSARPLHLFRGHFPNVLANGAPLGLPGEVRGPDHTSLVPT